MACYFPRCFLFFAVLTMSPPRSPVASPRHRLTLCASLVQNPMNLGALCRTAEVFRLHQLVLPSLDWAQNDEFRKLAVSAHQWQPLAACSVEKLPRWIAAQQQQSVCVIALTHYPKALPLPQFTFPKRAILLLGRELTGIPQSLVEQCDEILMIPQWGQVESLNVSTAAAIAAYAYVSQHGSCEK